MRELFIKTNQVFCISLSDFLCCVLFEVSQLPKDGGVDKQKQLSCSEGVLTDAELVGENSEQAVCTPQE